MNALDYHKLEDEIIGILGKKREIVVATCANNKVTARTVYFVCDGLTIFFVTSKAYTKYKQIIKNPNVALCVDNIQIEGVASTKGHPALDENKKITEYCLKHLPEYFERYLRYKNTVLIEVKANLVTLWRNGGREYLDITKGTAYRVG